jgi:hypothetical protein
MSSRSARLSESRPSQSGFPRPEDCSGVASTAGGLESERSALEGCHERTLAAQAIKEQAEKLLSDADKRAYVKECMSEER